jgi:hypothetical protein
MGEASRLARQEVGPYMSNTIVASGRDSSPLPELLFEGVKKIGNVLLAHARLLLLR